jgi:hypothetical protein
MRQLPGFAPSNIIVLFNQILSCAERFGAFARYDCHPEGRLIVEPAKDGFGVPVGGVVEGVAVLFAVDGYEEDVRGWVGEDVVLG